MDKNIKIFITDVDGCLTDGKIYYSDNGSRMRAYDMHDGVFFKLQQQNILTAFCSGESDDSIKHRAEKLNIDHIILGSKNKLQDISLLLEKLNLSFENVAYVGDDMADIEVMQKSALSFAPANAIEAVKKVAKHVTKKAGGEGAIREIIDTYFV